MTTSMLERPCDECATKDAVGFHEADCVCECHFSPDVLADLKAGNWT